MPKAQSKNRIRRLHQSLPRDSPPLQSRPGICCRFRDYSCLDRVAYDVFDSINILTNTCDDAALESIIPDVPLEVMEPIVAHCENTKDPLHQPRQRLASSNLHYEVKVVIHDAEHLDTKLVLCLCPLQRMDKQRLHLRGVQHELTAVCTRNNMVPTTIDYPSWFSHALEYRQNGAANSTAPITRRSRAPVTATSVPTTRTGMRTRTAPPSPFVRPPSCPPSPVTRPRSPVEYPHLPPPHQSMPAPRSPF